METIRKDSCSSERVIPNAIIMDERGDQGNTLLKVFIGYRNPKALTFPGRLDAEVRAHVCGDCGHVEIFVPDAGELWESWLQVNG